MGQLEHAEAVALMEWVEAHLGQLPALEMLYHVANEGDGNSVAGQYRLAEGVRPGVLDYNLDVARGGYHGLRFELKTRNGRLSPAQRLWIHKLTAQNYQAAVCFGWEEAARLLLKYLTLEGG